MADFFAFLGAADCIKLCPIYVQRTGPNRKLKPIADFITVFKDVPTQHDTRRFKYGEALISVQLTPEKGALLPEHMLVLCPKIR